MRVKVGLKIAGLSELVERMRKRDILQFSKKN